MDDTRKITEGVVSDALTPEILRRMVVSSRCKASGIDCGKSKAYSLTHADSATAGTWCVVHGWLFFDSVTLPPTEHLSDSELEDRRLEQRRKAEFTRRKAATPNNEQEREG